MALSDKWTTFFLVLGGPDPLTRDDMTGVLAPVLTQNFKAYDQPKTSVIAPNWKYRAEGDPMVASGGSDVGYYITAGALENAETTYAEPYPYVNGLLWQLYNRSVPADLRGALSQVRGEPFQSFVDAGYTVMRSGLYPYGTPIYGYLGWPAMPPLPSLQRATPAPAPSSDSTPWWLLALLALPLLKRH